MNKVLLQLWEESSTDNSFLSDGCSLHIDLTQRNNYISTIYGDRSQNIGGYDRIVGDFLEVFVTDKLYEMIKEQKTVKLPESSFQNLLTFEDIIYNKSEI